MLFSGIWSVVKNFVDKKTQEKIKIYGTNFKEKILKVIDEENLPEFLGGSSTTPLEQNLGPWNPNGDEYLFFRIFKIKKKDFSLGLFPKEEKLK